MRKFYFILSIIIAPVLANAQIEGTEVTWGDLDIQEFNTALDSSGAEILKPVFSDDQNALEGETIIISGNYHILNSFGAKSYLLSRDEIIKTPMQGDEVIRLIMEEDPKIYFGRTVRIQGVLHIDEDPNAETIYYITDVKKVKNTGTVATE